MSNKKDHLDMVDVENFLNEYDYYSGDHYVCEILNNNIELDLMRQAIKKLAEGKNDECQSLVDDMYLNKWWAKNE
tara:strand:+ start:30 stop:254 length:225 start_codon:yes stop_codon:yes gene_type:complete